MSYSAKQLIRAAKKKGYHVKEGAKHTLIYDPASSQHVSTVPRGHIKKGTLKAILKQLGMTEAELRKLI
jgi:hypothetical protein